MTENIKNTDLNDPRLKVLGARAVILEEKNEEKTSAGIILHTRKDEPTFRGRVVAVGDGSMLDSGIKVPMQVKVGDRVIFTNYSGSQVDVEGTIYMIVNERDITCIIED